MLPTLTSDDIIELRKSNFEFTEEFYTQFHDCIRQNPGKTILELLPLITFYNFTSFELLLAFKHHSVIMQTGDVILKKFLLIFSPKILESYQRCTF